MIIMSTLEMTGTTTEMMSTARMEAITQNSLAGATSSTTAGPDVMVVFLDMVRETARDELRRQNSTAPTELTGISQRLPVPLGVIPKGHTPGK